MSVMSVFTILVQIADIPVPLLELNESFENICFFAVYSSLWVINESFKKHNFCFKRGQNGAQLLKFCIYGRYIELLFFIPFWCGFYI
jgi:hypothetical protein